MASPGCRVLLVEDDPAQRASLALLLRLAGYGADTACHGADALESLHRGPLPCLIFLDLTMPVMDGWEFLRRRRESPTLAGVPVVVLSALGGLRREDLLSLGVSAVMQKPADPEEILAEIARH
jgi:CheY-like chemotaxis protein